MNDIERAREALKITANDQQRTAAIERARQEAISEVTGKPYEPVYVQHRNAGAYGSVQFGPDGSIVSRRAADGTGTTPAEEAILKAKSVARAEIHRMDAELQRLEGELNAVSGYNAKGEPKYIHGEATRERLRKQAAGLKASIAGQTQLNEIRFRKQAHAALDKLQARHGKI